MVNVTYFYEDGKPFNGTHLNIHIKSMNILTNFSDERLLYLETINIYSIYRFRIDYGDQYEIL